MVGVINLIVRAQARQAAREIDQVTQSTQRLQGAVARARATMMSMQGGMPGLSKFGNQLQWAGRQLQYNFTMPLALAGAAGAKFALDNEKAMVRVTKVYGDGTMASSQLRSETNALSKAFEALSSRFGVNQAEVIDIAGSWAAAGASGVALAKSVELTLDAMILGELEAAEATEALIAIQAQYGFQTKDLSRTLDVLNKVENQTGISMKGLIQGFSRAAGVARSAGIDVEHLAAMMAALVPAAGSAANAGNALKTIVSRLLSPTKEANEVLGLMGVNTKELAWSSLNGAQRLETLAKSFNNLDDAQKAVVSSVVASRWQINRFDVLMRDIINEHGYYQRALETSADATENYKQRVRELNAVLESNPKRLQQMWTILQNAMSDVMQPLLPYLVSMVAEIARLAQSFANLDPQTQKFIGGLALLLIAIGPVLRYLGSFMVLIGLVGLALFKLVSVIGIVALTMVSGLFSALKLIGTGMWGLVRILAAVNMAIVANVYVASLGMGAAAVGGMRAMLTATTAGLGSLVALVAARAPMMFGSVSLLWSAMMTATSFAFTRTLAFVQVFLFTTLPGMFVAARTFMIGVSAQLWLVMNAALTATVPTIMATMNWMMLMVGVVISRGWTAITVAMSAIGPAMATASSVAFGAIGLAFAKVMWGIRLAFFATQTFLVGGFTKLAAGIVLIWRTLMVNLFVLWKLLPGLIMSTGPAIAAAARAVGAAAVFAFTNPWGLLIVGVLAGLAIFWDEIVKGFQFVTSAITAAFNALPDGVKNAFIRVLQIVKSIALQIYEWMSYLNPFVRHSPSLVESVKAGMAEIQNQYGKVANVTSIFRKAARDLEAFKSATKGMGVTEFDQDRRTVAELAPAALPAFDALAANLGPLNKLLAEQAALVSDQQVEVTKWEAALKAADDAVDVQKAKLEGLQDQLDALTNAYDAHESKLREYANAPIKGMRAFEDQIFANEMAQKRLRLEMLRFEETNGSIDDLRDRLAKMAGEIETMKGSASELRQAGAGSDILGPINAEIAAMEAQYNALNGQMQNSPVNQMQKEMERLQREGEMLDLERALQFDPLLRQIDQLANGMEELTFEQIINGINTERAAMDALKPSIDSVSASVTAQEAALAAVQARRDSINASYDTEKDKLDALNEAYQFTERSISEIEQALSDVSRAASDANRDLSAAQSYMSPGAENFLAAEGGNFPEVGDFAQIGREGGAGDQTDAINALTEQWTNETAGILGSYDMWAPVKEKWNQFKGWWTTNVTPAWNEFTGGMTQAWDASGIGDTIGGLGDKLGGVKAWFEDLGDTLSVWGENIKKALAPVLDEFNEKIMPALKSAWADVKESFEGFRELGGPIIEALGNLWEIIKPILAIIGGALVGAFVIAFNILAEILPPIIKFIGDVISGIVNIVKGLINIIVGIFTLDGQRIWEGVKQIFGGIVEIVWGLIDGLVSLVIGLVKGLVEGIVDFFTWLWDVLVGHSIIPDMVNAIVQWFQDMWDWVVELVSGLVNGVIEWFQSLWDGAVEKVTGVYNAMKFWWGYIKNAVIDFVMKMAVGVIGWFLSLKTDLEAKMALIKELIRLAWDWIKTNTIEKLKTLVTDAVAKFLEIKTGIEGHINTLKTGVSNKFTDIRDSIMGAFEWVRDKIGGVFNTITTNIKNGVNAAIKAVNSLISGLNKVAEVLPGMDWNIPSVPLLAAGGIPGRRVGSGFKTNGARAIVGEGNPRYPEYVIPTDPAYRDRAQALARSLGGQIGVPMLAQGGILGAIKGAIGSVSSGIKNGVDWAKDAAAGLATKFLDPFMDIAQDKINNISWSYGKKAAQAGFDQMTSWRKDADKAYKEKADSMGGPLSGGAFSRAAGTWPPASGSGLSANAANAAAFVRNTWGSAISSIGGFAQRNIAGTGVISDHSRGKATDIMLKDYMGSAARRTGGEIAKWFVANPGTYGTKYVIYFDQINSGSGWKAYKHPGGSYNDTTQHRDHVHVSYLADGGVVRATRGGSLTRIGEGGRDEAVIPLPMDWRSVFTSLRAVNPDSMKRAAMAGTVAATRAQSGGRVAGTTYPAAYTHNEIHFHGDLSFPNITSGDDAQDFIDNLSNLAG